MVHTSGMRFIPHPLISIKGYVLDASRWAV